MLATFRSSGSNPGKFPNFGDWLIHDPEESGVEHDISVPGYEFNDPQALYEAGWVEAAPVPASWSFNKPASYVVVSRPREWPSSWDEFQQLQERLPRDMLRDEWLNWLIDRPAGYRVMIEAYDTANRSQSPQTGQPAEYQATLEALTGNITALPLYQPEYRGSVHAGWQPIRTATVPGGDWADRIDPVACLDLTRQITKDYGVDPADLVTAMASTINFEGLTELGAAFRPFAKYEAVPPVGTMIVSPDTGTWQVTAASRERWFSSFGGAPKRYIDVGLGNTDGSSLHVTRWGNDNFWGVELWVAPNGDFLGSHDIQQRGEQDIAAKPLSDTTLGNQLDRLCASSFQDLWQASPWDISPDKSVWIALPKNSPEPCTFREALCRATAFGDTKDEAVVLAQLKATNPGIGWRATDQRDRLLQEGPGSMAPSFTEQQAVWRQQSIEQVGAGNASQIDQMVNQPKLGMP